MRQFTKRHTMAPTMFQKDTLSLDFDLGEYKGDDL